MSTLLPHAWRARLALSSLKPSSTSFATFPSISCGPPAEAAGAGIGAGAGAAGVGASPPPLPPAPVSLVGDGGWALPLMCLGSSPSDRKGTETSRLGNLSMFVWRSMLHWYLLRLSRPNRNSMSSCSSTVMAQGRCLSPTFTGAWCTLPSIRLCPTPLAIPCHLSSSKCSKLHRSAQLLDMIVICAPLSTKAFSGLPLTSMFTYSITTLPKSSGEFSIALSMFSFTFCCWIMLAMRFWASGSKGSAWSKASSCCFRLSSCLRCSSTRLSMSRTPAASLLFRARASCGFWASSLASTAGSEAR
mmetsp:Transcript_538/g.1655  ORF Transcript_538/g.1655 Transcript_538/m.1655 type:complete len:302 (-) Transcript_538:412-1317(-)